MSSLGNLGTVPYQNGDHYSNMRTFYWLDCL